jgi:dienelactone hydrolase
MGTSRLLHASQAEYLASHGYIVVTLDHTYNTVATVFPDGRVTGYSSEPMDMDRNTATNKNLNAWSADIKFVLEQVGKMNSGDMTSRFTGKLDMDSIGIMGHSFGGATAFQVSTSLPQLKAGIDLDGSLFNLDQTYDITKPFMFMQSQNFIKMREKSKSGMTDAELERINLSREDFNTIIKNMDKEYRIIEQAVQHGGALVYIQGADHYNFTDFQFYSSLLKLMGLTGEINGSRGAEIVNHYVLDFFDKHLRGTGGVLLQGPNSKYPEVVFPYYN